MKKEAKIRKIVNDIKSIKTQGASNIARAALQAYSLLPTKQTKQKLVNARPTEPLLVNTLNNFSILGYKKTLEHFSQAQQKINQNTLKLIKNNSIIFTHCHSTNVIKALIYSKNKGKKFQVYNTETRPLFQGRKTALELGKAKIKVTMFEDSAVGIVFKGEQGAKKPDIIFLGCDAILKNGIVNKIGSGMIAELAFIHKIPLYIIADSWKFTEHALLEERDFHEVWRQVPKGIKIRNPSFEFIDKKYIKAIVSEHGVLSFNEFLGRVVKKRLLSSL